MFAGPSAAQSEGTASAVARGYPANQGEPTTQMRFLAKDDAAVRTASSFGIDVTEGTAKNEDGTVWIDAVVTPTQRAYLEALGYQPGQVIATPADIADRRSGNEKYREADKELAEIDRRSSGRQGIIA